MPECKTGSTWSGPAFRKLDLWVMKKSWTKPWTIGYEIKQSRSDFLNDTKWEKYLPYCSDFYFVAPPGIIQPEELPADVGLILTSKNLVRLYTKRKAVTREIEIPNSIFKYILMWRARIIQEDTGLSKQDYWKAWLAERDEKKELGWNVARKIKQLIEERIDKVENTNCALEAENKTLGRVKKLLEDLGHTGTYLSFYRIEDKIKAKLREIESGVPDGLDQCLDSAIKNLELIREKMRG